MHSKPRSRVGFYEKTLGLLAIIGIICAIVACATPTSLTQSVYVAEKSLDAVINGVADAHNAGVFVGPAYEKAKVVLTNAVEAAPKARKAAMLKDTEEVQKYLTIMNDATTQYIKYKKTGPPTTNQGGHS